jgi:hypothetical protein
MMYWPNFRRMFYRSFGTKNVGHYRLSWGVVSCSCLHTILISGCKGWSNWRTCQHKSHSIPHCTTNRDVNKSFREIGSFAYVNAEREQQHGEINVLAAVHWSPPTNMQNFQDDCCSTHRYCSMIVSISVTFKEGIVPWQEITPCMTLCIAATTATNSAWHSV